jgi:hypothetical protein
LTQDSLSTQAAATTVAAERAEMRPHGKAICILLPVWGDEYIDQFVERSLPTLLARGNIPALAKALPTRFVFLTRSSDEASIRLHLAFRLLERMTTVEFLPIDDLITSGNHSTTITLAYTRAVRLTGAAMLDTYFFFLVSDYVMADGSLASVLARMEMGASAVQAGNFQLDDNSAEPWLKDKLETAETALTLSSREVMCWALGCLHPLTAANVVNFRLCHNTHANRLLWQVDDNTLIGRFYLLHMICIRPETDGFVIGSSCDYSFVPEMCPSGNVVTITDSDEYLVVELQPHNHESHFLSLGPYSVEALGRSLSEWTTTRHRANAEQAIVFHAAPLPEILPAALAEAEEFVRGLTLHLDAAPQPHRNHPYWLGAIAAFDRDVAARDSGSADASVPRMVRIVRWIQSSFLGQVPEVKRQHPRWQDCKAPLVVVRELMTGGAKILSGTSRSMPLTDWLRRQAPDAVPFSLRRLMLNRPILGVQRGSFDAAFIELVDDYVTHMSEIVSRVAPYLRRDGEVVLVAFNTAWSDNAEHIGREFAAGVASLLCSKPWPYEWYVRSASRFRWQLNGACIRAAAALFRRPTIGFPLHLASAAILLPLAVTTNIISSWRPTDARQSRVPTSVLIRIRVNRTCEDGTDGWASDRVSINLPASHVA